MKDNKLQKLLDSAKNESAPQAGPRFVVRVMYAVQQEGTARPVSFLDQLNALFPRLAFASAVIIVLCVTADWVLSTASATDLVSGVSAISEDWLFPTKGF